MAAILKAIMGAILAQMIDCCLLLPKSVNDCSFYQINVILALTGRLFTINWHVCTLFDISTAILAAILKAIMGAILAQMVDWLSSFP